MVFVACSISYAWCATAAALLAVRCVHGVGMGLYPTANAAAIVDLSPRDRRGQLLGFLGAGAQLAMAAGPITGVGLMRRFGFTVVFGSSALIALTVLVFVAAVGETLGERTQRPFRLTSSFRRSALFPSLISLSLLATFGVQLAFLPIYAEAQGINPGAFFLALALVVAVVRGPGGGLSDRLGRPVVVIAGLVLAAAGLTTLAFTESLTGLLAAGVLFGLGFGSAHPTLMAWSVDGVAEPDRGKALGTYLAAFDLGFALGAGVSGLAVAVVGFRATFLGAAAVPLASAALVLMRLRLNHLRAKPVPGS